MEVRATAKYLRVQPRKVRIIADELRGQSAEKSVAQLRYHTSKSATMLHKVLLSAMANAHENHNLNPEDLKISTIMVDEGPRLKRMRARAMGRGNRITKKTSHITVVVEEAEKEARIRPHGTKAKPRRTLASGPRKKGAKPAIAEPIAAPAEDLVNPTAEIEVSEPPIEHDQPTEVVAESPETAVTETTLEEPAKEESAEGEQS